MSASGRVVSGLWYWQNLSITLNLKNILFSVHQMSDGQKHTPQLEQFHSNPLCCLTPMEIRHLPGNHVTVIHIRAFRLLEFRAFTF